MLANKVHTYEEKKRTGMCNCQRSFAAKKDGTFYVKSGNFNSIIIMKNISFSIKYHNLTIQIFNRKSRHNMTIYGQYDQIRYRNSI